MRRARSITLPHHLHGWSFLFFGDIPVLMPIDLVRSAGAARLPLAIPCS